MYLNQLVPEFIAQSTASPSDGNVSLGIYCDKLGVVLICVLQHFRKEKLSIAPKKAKVLLLSNGALLYDLSKTYHGQSSVLLFHTLLMMIYCTYHSRISLSPCFFFNILMPGGTRH